MDEILASSRIGPPEWAFVYLLVDVDHRRFKIGFSIDPLQRLKSIATKIDKNRSMQVSCEALDMRRLEIILHAWFDVYHIDPGLIDDSNGHTEWFDFNCWEMVIAYLTDHHAWLRCTVPAPLDDSRPAHIARRQSSYRGKRISSPTQLRRTVTLELGLVCSMADLMEKAEASFEGSIIGKPLTLTRDETAGADHQRVFGRLFWEAAILHKRGIVRLHKPDVYMRSLTITRLNNEAFDTKSLYGITPHVSRQGRRRGSRVVEAESPKTLEATPR